MESARFPFLTPDIPPNLFNSAYKSATPEEILRRAINNGEIVPLPTCGKWSGRDIAGS